MQILHSYYEYEKAYEIRMLLLRKRDMVGLSEGDEKELEELTLRVEDYENNGKKL